MRFPLRAVGGGDGEIEGFGSGADGSCEGFDLREEAVGFGVYV